MPYFVYRDFSYYNGVNEIKMRYEESFWKAADEVNSDIREKIEELNDLTLQMVSQKEIKHFVLQEPDAWYEKYDIKQWGERQLFCGGSCRRIIISAA